MATTRTRLSALTSPLLRAFTPSSRQCAVTCATRSYSAIPRADIKKDVPKPTPFVPDVKTFLSLIGRDMIKHVDKFQTWDHLFASTGRQLQEMGIEPARQRRYLLRWMEKFRNRKYGVGGDLEFVTDGVAELRVVEVPRKSALLQQQEKNVAGKKKTEAETEAQPKPGLGYATTGTALLGPGLKYALVNLPPGETKVTDPTTQVKTYKGLRLDQKNQPKGPWVKLSPGSKGKVATLAARERLWEDVRGVKIDGGERRRAEVRVKKLSKGE